MSNSTKIKSGLKEFLDLGMQPLANGFLTKEQLEQEEYMFHMRVGFDEETSLVSLMETPDPGDMFNENYHYESSHSSATRLHFISAYGVVRDILREQQPNAKVLEIGSNDGVFIKHFASSAAVCVEPCANFAQITDDLGINTYNEFWNMDTAELIKTTEGAMDVVYSANCMCHIPDIKEAFSAVAHVLNDGGVFVFEDPSITSVLKNISYDQFYDEHAHIFSVTALKNLLRDAGLKIIDVEHLSIHGGSNRIYAVKTSDRVYESRTYHRVLAGERYLKVDELGTYENFAAKVQKSAHLLNICVNNIIEAGYKVASYGATSKSTTIFNYAGLTSDKIEYVTDTTESKIGKFTPGTHIPIYHRDILETDPVEYAFLGAWNFAEHIKENERLFIKGDLNFITHVPEIKVLKRDGDIPFWIN